MDAKPFVVKGWCNVVCFLQISCLKEKWAIGKCQVCKTILDVNQCYRICLTQNWLYQYLSRLFDRWLINANEPCLVCRERILHVVILGKWIDFQATGSSFAGSPLGFDSEWNRAIGDFNNFWREQYLIRSEQRTEAVERAAMINLNHVMSSRSLDYYHEIRL